MVLDLNENYIILSLYLISYAVDDWDLPIEAFYLFSGILLIFIYMFELY